MTSTAKPIVDPPTIPVIAFGMGLSTFFAISFVLCVLGYGHSRMREMVLGGASRELLSNMTVPLLLSH